MSWGIVGREEGEGEVHCFERDVRRGSFWVGCRSWMVDISSQIMAPTENMSEVVVGAMLPSSRSSGAVHLCRICPISARCDSRIRKSRSLRPIDPTDTSAFSSMSTTALTDRLDFQEKRRGEIEKKHVLVSVGHE